MTGKRDLNIAMIGHRFMGRAHANAWRQAPRFFNLPVEPVLKVVCGRDPDAAASAAERHGFAEAAIDWREVVARQDVDVVDVCVPGALHHDVVVAAARHGKHVLCEKPLANSLSDAVAMRDAVVAAGIVAMVCHNYRRVPAVQLAKRILDEGTIGHVVHYRASYLQDWLADPLAPASWRLSKRQAGSGALGDLGSHVFDLARFLVGEVASVTASMTTFTNQRPDGLSGAMVDVDVDDAFLALLAFSNGATGSVECSRVALGRRNANRFEINGSRGSLVFDLERMNELQLYKDSGAESGFTTILVTDPAHPYIDRWWPAGHIIGYEHSFVHTVAEFVTAVATGQKVAPDFDDGVAVQRLLDATATSSSSGTWQTIRAK